MPPRAQDRRWRHRVYNLRDQHHAADVPGVAASLVGLGDDDINLSILMAHSMAPFTGQGADENAFFVCRLNHIGGRGAERADQKPGLVLQGNINDPPGFFLRVTQPTSLGRRRIGRQFGHPDLFQQLVEKLLMRLRNKLLKRFAGQPALVGADIVGRHHQIDPIRDIAQLLVYPGEINLQPLVGMNRRPKHAQPARLADRHDHIPAVGEGKNRELDSEHVSH